MKYVLYFVLLGITSPWRWSKFYVTRI